MSELGLIYTDISDWQSLMPVAVLYFLVKTHSQHSDNGL